MSDSWLASGRRERKFVLGRFETDYVRNTPMMAALNGNGIMLGFVNMIPCYARHTATIDLMRHRADAPNSLMDYLFLKLFAYNQAQGVHYFSMGPAPITHLASGETATREETIFYELTHVLDAFFSMEGLRTYKAKFATIWEPRYIIHRRVTDWPRVVNAFTALTEFEESKQPLLGKQRRQQMRQVTTEVIAEIRRIRAERQVAKETRPVDTPNESPAGQSS
ncbi:MAG: phosphatidylglycerol lysyltransferase domain-containing protein [Caldilineaceae bacterium]